MYCRNCLKGNKNRKITMETNIEEKCYVCPECGHVVNWNAEENREEEK
jgi:hypothetical protein